MMQPDYEGARRRAEQLSDISRSGFAVAVCGLCLVLALAAVLWTGWRP